jgi:hypothetical protein
MATCIVFLAIFSAYSKYKKRRSLKIAGNNRLNIFPYGKIESKSNAPIHCSFKTKDNYLDSSMIWEDLDESVEFNTLHNVRRLRTDDSC